MVLRSYQEKKLKLYFFWGGGEEEEGYTLEISITASLQTFATFKVYSFIIHHRYIRHCACKGSKTWSPSEMSSQFTGKDRRGNRKP